jgi:MFS family permease
VLIIIASFVIIFTGCGLGFAFGVYQALYDSMSLEPSNPFTDATPAEIDLIGTLSISLMTIGAPFAVAWSKAFSPRNVILAGAVISGLANIAASFGTRLWHFELSQGFLQGLGCCLAYMPAVTVAPTWFTKRRGFAMGISESFSRLSNRAYLAFPAKHSAVLSGTGVGGVVWAPALKASIDALGFRNTLRITGIVAFALIAAAAMVVTWSPVAEAQIRASRLTVSRAQGLALLRIPLLDWRVARQRKFLAQASSALFQSAAYYTPVFFFASYARTLGYSDATGANFIAISNACNAVGKIAIGFAADRVGRLNTLFLTTFLSAVVTIGFWVPSSTRGDQADTLKQSQDLFIAFAILYGIFASAYVSLFPTSLVELFGVQHFPSVNGVLYMVRGLATMIGTPTGGALIRGSAAQFSSRSYENMALLVAVLLFAASASTFWVRIEAMIQHGRTEWRLKL